MDLTGAENQQPIISDQAKTKMDAIIADPEKSLAFLVKAGLYTSDGKLTPEYGGE
jgi:hypothetical protein